MVDINKNCLLDSDCDKNKICAFNEKDLNNYCISNSINDLYYGCASENYDFESIENKSNNNDLYECINFTRRQLNKDDLEYNYMIFKPKKDAFVDTSTINIYLKCEEEILAAIPYEDYFNINCENNQKNCILTSKESLLNFIIQNTKNCSKNIYLDIIYKCENEGIEKTEKIPININNFNPIKINLICPIDKNNDKFKSKCESIYINDISNSNLINKSKNINECKNPLFKVPRLVKNINKYKQLKSKNSKDELKDYDKKINQKIEDLKKLEAEKYIKVKKLKNDVDISYEESYDIINKKPLDKLITDPHDNWKIYKNYDAAYNLYHDDEKNKVLTYYGKVYTINDAIKIADQNEQNYFVWYHNSYELSDFASKLYFIDIYYGDQEVLKKKNWVKHENVTTGVLKFNIESFADINTEDIDKKDESSIIKIFENAKVNNNNLQKEIKDLVNNYPQKDQKNINNNIIKYYDHKNTTYRQAILMNEYEENINNKILLMLSIISIIVFITLIFVIAYFNYKYTEQIKLL